MRRSADVQDERYGTGAWMRKSADVQDERYGTGAWMRKSANVQNELGVSFSSVMAPRQLLER
jgi:hypothetical protein